jgi:predicted alpha/beta-hydrolase family hydrolase
MRAVDGAHLQKIERRHVRAAMIATTAVVLVGALAFAAWWLKPLGPSEAALDALRTDDTVTVTELAEGWLFEPSDNASGDGAPEAGVVLYPGGRVEPRSYAPLARAVAERGYTVALASMPLNLAVLDPGRAGALMDAAADVERWAVGGHSLGGAMAAAYATEHDERVRGLVLLAAYPAASTDLSASGLVTLSIVGTHDEVINHENWAGGIERLPADTVYLTLEGADHAQFGDYGLQPGDGEATITRAEQQRLTADAIAELLGGL